MNKAIAKPVIRRMPRYYRYLGELVDQGVERISSQELSAMMHVTSSQIRQDLNQFGEFGQQGYGYSVPYLHAQIGRILGVDQDHRMIIVGAGNLGQAIVKYDRFMRLGFKTIALFDTDPTLIGNSVNGVPILPLSGLDSFCEENLVDIAALTIPKTNAAEIADRLIEHGVTAIWNFAHVDLDVRNKNVVVENVHLTDSLMQLSFNIAQSMN